MKYGPEGTTTLLPGTRQPHPQPLETSYGNQDTIYRDNKRRNCSILYVKWCVNGQKGQRHFRDYFNMLSRTTVQEIQFERNFFLRLGRDAAYLLTQQQSAPTIEAPAVNPLYA